MKTILRAGGVLIAGVLAGYLLLVLSYCIPGAWLTDNLEASAAILAAEGEYPADPYSEKGLDNYTEAILLSEAGYDGSESPLKKAAASYFSVAEAPDGEDTAASLPPALVTGRAPDAISYARYWHGYVTVLRPLLAVFRYDRIRTLNTVLQALLLAAVLIAVYRRMPESIAAWLFFILLLTPSAVCRCLQYAHDVTLMLLALLLLPVCWDRRKRRRSGSVAIFFMLFGMATAYVDLLTGPLLTLLPPLCFLTALMQAEDMRPREVLVRLLLCCAAWGAGYAGMWAGKWIIAAIAEGGGFAASVIDKISLRLSTAGAAQETGRLRALRLNLAALFENRPLAIASLTYGAALAVCGLFTKGFLKGALSTLLPYALTALIPFIWIAVLSNHSCIHYWFTYRTLAPAVLAALIGLSRVALNRRLPQKL